MNPAAMIDKEKNEMASSIKDNSQDQLLPSDPTEQIRKLQEELITERNHTAGALADLATCRLRLERDGDKSGEEGKRAIILSLLEIVDDMEKALRWVSNGTHASAKGVRFLYEKLLVLLNAHGVTPFDSVGTVFDPDRHEAVATTPDGTVEVGSVVDDLRRGYLWNDVLLRPAQVRVAG